MQEETLNNQVIIDFTRIFKNEHNVGGVDHLFDTKNFMRPICFRPSKPLSPVLPAITKL
jgi:hypothetical protein